MSDETLSTKERLAQAIEARRAKAIEAKEGNGHGLAVQRMIQRAREGYYDDYESPLATPMINLVNDLRAVGFGDLAERAIDGEFDGTKEEGEAWMKREGINLLKNIKRPGRK